MPAPLASCAAAAFRLSSLSPFSSLSPRERAGVRVPLLSALLLSFSACGGTTSPKHTSSPTHDASTTGDASSPHGDGDGDATHERDSGTNPPASDAGQPANESDSGHAPV